MSLACSAAISETIPAGGRWSRRLETGDRIRIIDTHGQQGVDFLPLAAEAPFERYNSGNTIKMARSVYLETGTILYSEAARPMLRIVADTCGRHDTLASCCSAEMNELRYGVANTPNCRDNFTAELALWNRPPQDLVPNANFFMNMPVEADGHCEIRDCLSKPGDYVELVAEMPVIVLISNCPQENNPCAGFGPTPIEVVITKA